MTNIVDFSQSSRPFRGRMPCVLVVGPDVDECVAFRSRLRALGYDVLLATSARQILSLLEYRPAVAVVADRRLPIVEIERLERLIPDRHPGTRLVLADLATASASEALAVGTRMAA